LNSPAQPTRPTPFLALRSRNFRLFFVGQFISVVGTWMQTMAQQWLVYELTHSASWLGIVTGAGAVPYVLLTLHGGKAADRYPRRTILVITQAAAMLLAFALALLNTNWIVPIRPWHIALLAALSGVVNAYNMPAQQAFVSEMVDDPAMLGNAIALNSLQFNVARVCGPVLAGVTLARFGATACFFLNGLSYIAVIISLIMMHLPPFVPVSRQLSLVSGFHYLARNRGPLRVILLVGAASLGAWSVSTLYPVYSDKFAAIAGTTLAARKQASAVILGRMMSASGVGAAIGGLLVASFSHRFARRFLLYIAAIFFGVTLLFFGACHSELPAMPALMLSGIFMTAFGITANTMVQEQVPDALRGRVMAIYSFVFGGLMPLGGLEIGFVANHLGASKAVYLNVGGYLFCVLLTLLWSQLDKRSQGLPLDLLETTSEPAT
jgi:MFS family permease